MCRPAAIFRLVVTRADECGIDFNRQSKPFAKATCWEKMNAPSRNMPPRLARPKATFVTWIVLAVLVGGLAWGMVASVPLRWAIGGTAILIAVLTAIDRRRLKRIRQERKTESICTFARSLPAKDHDTWVVRAVYEEVSHHVRAPIRPSDNVVKFWGIDGDDLDDAAFRIADRAGRSMDNAERNPFFDRVHTVADMIAFFEHQPKLPNSITQPPLTAG